MKKVILYILLLFSASVLLSSCQEEIVEINEPPAEQAFTATAPLADLINRIALKDGSEDNIISQSSCISFALPVTVLINGQKVIVESEEDFEKIERILDEFEDDEDNVQVIFPVTVVLPDYNQVIIHNEDDLEDYIEDCVEGGLDDDIECVDFKYPLQFSLYDAQNQVTDKITVSNDQQLFQFLENIEDDVYVSLDFPVTLILSDGSEIKAYNNNELESIIEDSKDDCDEDDDNDFDDDDIDDSELRTILTNSSWRITYFFDVSDQTEFFNGWNFSFNEDGTVFAADDADSFEGDWESYGDSGVLELDIDFDSVDPVKELDEEWEVLEYSESRIQLEDTSGGSAVTVVFEKI